MKEPFEIWWDENMMGFGVSDELRKLLANAFAGGMEASSGMKSVAVKKISYVNLMRHIHDKDRDPHEVGEPEFVAIWPLPPSMADEEARKPRTPSLAPTEKLRSFMGDVAWGDLPVTFSPPTTSKTMYEPSTDTWKTRTGSTDRFISAEEWHTTEAYDDMSREERDREMTRIADLIRARIDESVLEKIRSSPRPVEYKLAEPQNEHIIAHRNFVEAMSSHKDKILSEKQRVVLAKKKKRLKDKAVADRIDELSKIFEDKNERA
jgi:hypothetical protein